MKFFAVLSCTAAILLAFAIATQGAPASSSSSSSSSEALSSSSDESDEVSCSEDSPQDSPEGPSQDPWQNSSQEPPQDQPPRPPQGPPQVPPQGPPQSPPTVDSEEDVLEFDFDDESWLDDYADEQQPAPSEGQPQDQVLAPIQSVIQGWVDEQGPSPRTFLLLPLLLSSLFQ